MNKIIIQFLVPIIFIFTGCKDPIVAELEYSNPFNGTIEYELTYPYNENDDKINVYPTKLIAEIENNIIHTSIVDLGVKIDFYIDTEKKEINQFFDILLLPDNYHVCLKEEDINKLNNSFAKYDYIETKETDSINHCMLTKILAVQKNNPSKKIDLWHTEDIKIKNHNFFGNFSDINKTLLNFETTSLGIKTKVKATQVIPHKLKVDFITSKKGYTTVSLDTLEKKVADLFGNY